MTLRLLAMQKFCLFAEVAGGGLLFRNCKIIRPRPTHGFVLAFEMDKFDGPGSRKKRDMSSSSSSSSTTLYCCSYCSIKTELAGRS